ncbi:hypothetical protein LDENG_00245100 [Lucifuga dentata]|nr:hypothetical protein LDENG_00245100 [Lucifuga dentata]
MVPVGVSCFFLLSNLGAFTIAQAQNCTPPVGGSAMVLSDDHILQKSFLDGSTATFVCQVGYTSAGGSGVVTCTAGSWSAVALTCKSKY